MHQNYVNMALNLNKNLKLYYSMIHNLVKVRGFKISAAKKMINANRKGVDKKVEVISSLMDIRTELQALKKQLDYLQ